MKTHIAVLCLLVLMVCLLIEPSAFSAGETGKAKQPAIHLLPAPPAIIQTGTGDIFNGTVQLCLTAMPNDPGLDSVVDCMTLSISPVPSGLDFGDAPETGGFFSYPTTLAYNGAAHVIDPGIFLGNFIDGEPDGQPDTTAFGDDAGLNYPSFYDDEDGVTLPAAAAAGTMVTINVKASVNGYL
jgi:hypothetical protein